MGTSIQDIRLRRIRQYVEPANAFGISDAANVGADSVDIPVIESTWAPQRNQEHLDPMVIQQYLDGKETSILGKASSAVNFAMLLASHGLLLDGSQAAANLPTVTTGGTGKICPAIQTLATVMGGFNTAAALGAPAQTKVQAASTSTSIIVTAGHGLRWGSGGNPSGLPIGITINGRMEVGIVKSVLADTLTMEGAFSAGPTANNTVVCYGGASCYLTEDPQTSLQFVGEGAMDYDRYVYGGLQGNFGLDLKVGQLPRMTFTLTGPLWALLSNAAMGAASFVQYQPLAMVDAQMVVRTVGSTTRNLIHFTETSIAPAITYEDVTTPSVGVQTVLRKRRVRKNPVCSGSLTTFRDHAEFDFEAAQLASTQLAMIQQIGSTPGATVVIEIPTFQTKRPNDKPGGNLAALTVPWDARLDQEVGITSEYLRSAIRVHFL